MLSATFRRHRHGFTLVELLMVIAIIGFLIALLLPAVQGAREAGRRAQCSNNLHQIGLAALAHEEAHGFYPADGWGWYWVGDPDRGFGANQCGGWIYNILPYTDQTELHDLGWNGDSAAKRQAAIKLVRTPLPFANCPTRRRTILFPAREDTVAYNAGGISKGDIPGNHNLAHTDYAACAGDAARDEYWPGPDTAPAMVTVPWHDVLHECTGVVFECSEVKSAQITDGASNTIFAGEKYLDPANYNSAEPFKADNENQFAGMDNDNTRCTSSPPMLDRYGCTSTLQFGSAHAQSCFFTFCDGSVHPLSYSIAAEAFQCLGNRADGQVISASNF
jgi:prepilin-type N-terminal cleavage/methylation domain-containing protein